MSFVEIQNSEGVKTRLAAFDREHGESVFEGGWILFEDGAAREGNPLGLLLSPPDDQFECAKRIALYHKISFHRSMREFDSAKKNLIAMVRSNLMQPGGVCGPAPQQDQAIGDLRRLQQKVLRAKKRFDDATAQAEAAQPVELRNRVAMDSFNRRSNEELLNEVNKIEI